MKLKLAPILKMLTITVTVATSIYFINTILLDLPNYETLIKESSWILADLVHVPQFLIPFITILYITKGKTNPYGFNLKEDPPERARAIWVRWLPSYLFQWHQLFPVDSVLSKHVLYRIKTHAYFTREPVGLFLSI